MKKKFYEYIFIQLMGWKIVGSIQPEIKKCVLMVLPHTSWQDFYLGIFAREIIGLEMNYIAKKELFKFPLKYYFTWMGGEPLDRTGGLNKVDSIAKIFYSKAVFRLAIFPEGTRKKVSVLKTGFYYIALKANVPIVPVSFNFAKKEINIGQPLFPTGSIEEDVKLLLHHFKGVYGKNADNSFEV